MATHIPIAVQDTGTPAYVSEQKVYPREVHGPLDRLRTLAVFWLLGMYYAFPWLRWDGRQAVLFDLPARKFHVFEMTFWPQDFLFLALLLALAALLLFFVTALAGRLWCGYACPQTVWTEVFMWMERHTEGNRLQRIKLDAAPWTWGKLRRKGSKHLLWAIFALWTGFTFVGFFTPITELAARLTTLSWGGWETFWVLFYSLATWGNAGFLREQVCKYMCPYARFQSAMFDRDTLIIAYDPMRGEPRGPRRRGQQSVLERARGLLDLATAYDYVFRAIRTPTAGTLRMAAAGSITLAGPGVQAAALPSFEPDAFGDCIDCTICVQACPTGIDIRNGLQYECIACGACVDACNDVMGRLDWPRGLIRYTTQNALDGRATRILRPRILVYATLLAILMAGWVWGVTDRSRLIVDLLRDRNALYRTVENGRIENNYTLKLVNKDDAPHDFTLALESDTAGIVLLEPVIAVHAAAEEVLSVPVRIAAPASVGGRHDLRLIVQSDAADTRAEVDATFLGPM